MITSVLGSPAVDAFTPEVNGAAIATRGRLVDGIGLVVAVSAVSLVFAFV